MPAGIRAMQAPAWGRVGFLPCTVAQAVLPGHASSPQANSPAPLLERATGPGLTSAMLPARLFQDEEA